MSRYDDLQKAQREELAAVQEKKRQLEQEAEAKLRAPRGNVFARWRQIRDEAEAAKKAVLDAHKAEGDACWKAENEVRDKMHAYRHQLYGWEHNANSWIEEKYVPLLAQARVDDLKEEINKFLSARKGKPFVLPGKWEKRRWNQVYQNSLLLEVSVNRTTKRNGQVTHEGSARATITPAEARKDLRWSHMIHYNRLGPSISGEGRHVQDAIRAAEELGIQLGLFTKGK